MLPPAPPLHAKRSRSRYRLDMGPCWVPFRWTANVCRVFRLPARFLHRLDSDEGSGVVHSSPPLRPFPRRPNSEFPLNDCMGIWPHESDMKLSNASDLVRPDLKLLDIGLPECNNHPMGARIIFAHAPALRAATTRRSAATQRSHRCSSSLPAKSQ